MKPLSHLTCKILAIAEVPNFNMDDCIDWALDMLSLGHESPSLLMLAGISKPTSYYEAANYLRDACRELNLEMKTGEDGILSYSSYYITRIALGEQVKTNLALVHKYYRSIGHQDSIFDFYLLHWAWSDLEYGLEYQHYWEGATKENIADLTIRRASEWLETNKGRLLADSMRM